MGCSLGSAQKEDQGKEKTESSSPIIDDRKATASKPDIRKPLDIDRTPRESKNMSAFFFALIGGFVSSIITLFVFSRFASNQKQSFSLEEIRSELDDFKRSQEEIKGLLSKLRSSTSTEVSIEHPEEEKPFDPSAFSPSDWETADLKGKLKLVVKLFKATSYSDEYSMPIHRLATRMKEIKWVKDTDEGVKILNKLYKQYPSVLGIAEQRFKDGPQLFLR